tara:strand:+ start:40 stop:213 length:174 start_codon:yes stop_codon:yes gene_type:complete
MKVEYEINIYHDEGFDYIIPTTVSTDYMVEAMDIRDKWVERGANVTITKITHEKVEL